MTPRAARAIGTLGLAVLAAALPGADPAAADSGEGTAAFRETDRNGDGFIDRAEFHERAVELFFFADGDRDGFATAAELDPVVLDPGGCAAADRDRDGRISLPEFVELRFARYGAADTDGDGRLSRAEVAASYAGR